MDNEDVSILVIDNDSETRLQNGDAEFSNTEDDQNDANDYQNLNGEDKDEMIMMTDMNGQSTLPKPGQKDNNSDNISLNHTSDDFLVSTQEDPSGAFSQSPGIAQKMEAKYIDDHTMMVFSSDPSKRIDYILVLPKEPLKDSDQQKHHEHMRKEFEKNLADFGMELNIIEPHVSSDNHEYVQVHCPFDVLARGASVIKLRKPVINKKLVFGSSKGCFSKLSCFKLKSDVLSGDEDSYQLTEPFDVKHEKRFVKSEEGRDELFTYAERSLITHDLLERIQFKDSNNQIHQGVECLIQHGVYVAAFPLHDHLKAKEVMAKEYDALSNDRERLYHEWAHPKNIFHFQPLPLVRQYFGEQLTFYFAWIGWYTFLLFPAALAGLAVFIYGLATYATRDIPVRDVCNPDAAPGNFILCPKCDFLCNYTRLSDTCPYAKFTRIFDNQATLALAIFMSFWAICFLEIWRRAQTNLQYQWNVADFDQDEHFRPEFVIKVKTTKKNPVSNTEDPHVPAKKKLVLRCASISVILFMASVVIVTIFAVLVYRVAVVWAIYQVEYAEIKSHAQIITTVTSAIINVIAILILGLIYERLAKALTDFEVHKTQTSYNDSYTLKMIVFQFINFYGSIIYIAFFKGSFVDRPGLTTLYMFNRFKQDQCDESGCFAELTIQLIIIMVGKQIIGGILEIFIPLLKRCWRKRDNMKALNMRWEQDFDLAVLPPIPVFDEYLEMVIQYGFVVLFVAAFPLAPLCALLNNMIEVRLDAYKLLTLFRRQPAYRAQDIGAWQSIITIFTYLAVVTNAFIIAWTSEFIPKQVYKFTHNTFDLTGYVEWSLIAFNTSEFQSNQRPDPGKFPESVNITECRYRPFGLPSSEVSSEYEAYFWHILCARWAFVIIFEHTCFLLMNMAWVIPSVSRRVKMIKQYEKKICTESNVEDLFEKVRDKRIKMMNTMNTLSGTAITGNSNLSSRFPV